jgi:Flp pilus assembly protein TadB
MTLGALAAAIGVTAIVLALAVPRDTRLSTRGLGTAVRALTARARSRRGVSATGVIDVLRSTHAALRSGLPLPLALRTALDGSDQGPRSLFGGVRRALDLNGRLDDALRSAVAQADPRAALGLEALALVAAEELAAPRAAAVVGSVCDRLAFEARLQAEVRARTGGLRAQMVLLAVLVPALATYLVLTVPGVGATLTSTVGSHVLIPAALSFEIAGIVASHTIIRGVRA